MINPYAILAALLLWIATGMCAFFYGQHVGKQGCKAWAFADVTAAIEQHNAAGQRIDAIGTATATVIADQINTNRSATDESAERIRTVVVPGDCRRVDPAILRELGQARDDANASLGVGLRSGAAAAGTADPRNAPGN